MWLWSASAIRGSGRVCQKFNLFIGCLQHAELSSSYPAQAIQRGTLFRHIYAHLFCSCIISAFLVLVGRVGGVRVINFERSRDCHHAASCSREAPVADI